jgi:hypothetical protein
MVQEALGLVRKDEKEAAAILYRPLKPIHHYLTLK